MARDDESKVGQQAERAATQERRQDGPEERGGQPKGKAVPGGVAGYPPGQQFNEAGQPLRNDMPERTPLPRNNTNAPAVARHAPQGTTSPSDDRAEFKGAPEFGAANQPVVNLPYGSEPKTAPALSASPDASAKRKARA